LSSRRGPRGVALPVDRQESFENLGFEHREGHMASREEGERADTIVVGTDGSESAARAVREAARLARMTGARLVIVSAFSDLHPYREHIQSGGQEDLVHLGAVADQLLMRAAAEVDGDDIGMETVSRQGDPAQVLADVATEENAQLIIVGDRGLSGVERFLLGSVSHKVSHHAPCSVLIVRDSQT
jgi:nucleotide-binding universal stress UspA family protein